MEPKQGEVQYEPPHPDEYAQRLVSVLRERAAELRGSTRAVKDMLADEVKSVNDLDALLVTGQTALANAVETPAKHFLFNYVEELEKIIARVKNEKLEGNKYDA